MKAIGISGIFITFLLSMSLVDALPPHGRLRRRLQPKGLPNIVASPPIPTVNNPSKATDVPTMPTSILNSITSPSLPTPPPIELTSQSSTTTSSPSAAQTEQSTSDGRTESAAQTTAPTTPSSSGVAADLRSSATYIASPPPTSSSISTTLAAISSSSASVEATIISPISPFADPGSSTSTGPVWSTSRPGCWAYSTKQGDTFKTIANLYNFPETLLAWAQENNGIDGDAIVPGQTVYLLNDGGSRNLPYYADCSNKSTITPASDPPPKSQPEYIGVLPLSHNMGVPIDLPGVGLSSLMISTVNSGCSFLVNPHNFSCSNTDKTLGPPFPHYACDTSQLFKNTSSPLFNATDRGTSEACTFALGHTTISGKAVNTSFPLTGPAAVNVTNILLANNMSSSIFNLNNFIHDNSGVLGVFPRPPSCRANNDNEANTIPKWNTSSQTSSGTLIYIAAHRNATTHGIFARGTIPPSNSTISTTPLSQQITALVKADILNEDIHYQNGYLTECEWTLPVARISFSATTTTTTTDLSNLTPSPSPSPTSTSSTTPSTTPYLISTLSRFNFIPPSTAALIATLFSPPAILHAGTSLYELPCNATPPATSTSPITLTIGNQAFPINPADMIVRSFPPDYDLCFSAWQGWNSSVAGGTGDTATERGILGWPFLRSTGVAFDAGTGMWNITSRPDYDP